MDSTQKYIQLLAAPISKIKGAFDLTQILRQLFFTETEGRCLILQNLNNYGVFFMKPELFDWEEKKQEQIQELWELAQSIQQLKNEGYLYSINGLERKQSISALYTNYDKVNLNQDKIIFNADGDYSIQPHAILNKDGQVKFKGVVYEGDYYYSLLQTLSGIYMATPKLTTLIDPENHSEETKTPSSAQKGSFLKNHGTLLLLSLVFIGCISIFFWLFKHHSQSVQDQLTTLKQSNQSISKNIQNLSSSPPTTSSSPSSTSSFANIPKGKKALYGIDISHYQGDVVEELTFSDSITFIICKATEGKYYVDPFFKTNWPELKKRDYTRGAYHFYVTNIPPEEQAEHFLATIGEDFDSKDISLIVDIEKLSIPKGTSVNKDTLNEELLKFLNIVESKTKRIPIIYTSNGFADEYLFSNDLAKYPLWIAEYTKLQNPRIPEIWKNEGFKIWQRADNYSIDSEHSDFDVFYGEIEELLQ